MWNKYKKLGFCQLYLINFGKGGMCRMHNMEHAETLIFNAIEEIIHGDTKHSVYVVIIKNKKYVHKY